jgi:quercetin dioxygenase-like cupin family protein
VHVPIDADRLGAIATGRSTYDDWRQAHPVPVVTGYHVRDIAAVETAPWPWKGGAGAFLDLEGTGEKNDGYLLDIAPGRSTNPMKHMYEELVYVVAGRGATSVWLDPSDKRTFEWHAGSLFAIPLNASYQHHNASGADTARVLAVTSAPLIINLFHNLDFVYNCPFDFTDRFNGDDDFFSGAGRALEGRVWDTNFVADVDQLPLILWDERGKGSTNRMIELADSSMCAHVSEFAVGRYKKAHRHGPGAHVVILSGEGYTLMWPEGGEPQRFDWGPGSLVVPPNMWYHQHFNVGDRPAKYLALRWNSAKYKVFADTGIAEDVKHGGNQIETADEDPRIREMFEAALASRGVTVAQ